MKGSVLLIHSASFPSVSDARKIRGGLNGFWFGVTNKGRSHNLGKLIKSVSSLTKRKKSNLLCEQYLI